MDEYVEITFSVHYVFVSVAFQIYIQFLISFCYTELGVYRKRQFCGANRKSRRARRASRVDQGRKQGVHASNDKVQGHVKMSRAANY